VKRKKFAFVSGSTIFSGYISGAANQPALGLDFALSNPDANTDPSSVNTLTVKFDKLELVPKYLDSSESLKVTAKVELEDGTTSRKKAESIGFRNGQVIDLNHIENESKDISTLLIDGFTTNKSLLTGVVKLTVSHPDISDDSYEKRFSISNENSIEDFEDGTIDLESWPNSPQWSGNTGYLSTTTDSISGSISLYDKRVNTSDKSQIVQVPRRPSSIELDYKWNVISTGALGDGFEIVFYSNDGQDYICKHRVLIDDTPDGDDYKVVQPHIYDDNDSYNLDQNQNTVYTYRWDFDWNSGTFDFLVDGSVAYSDRVMRNTYTNNFSVKLSGDADGNDWERWIDNMRFIV
jgi:hypothetical protein